MKPAPFDLARPTTISESLELLTDASIEVRSLAGGQSLIPLLNFRLSRPDLLVSLNRVDELVAIVTDGDDLVIGAMTRQRAAEQSPVAAAWCPLLRDALGHVAHVAIRNRGTVGGSVAHADPAAELPALALAVGARLTLRSLIGERTVRAEDFFLGTYETALRPGEILVDLRIPRSAPGSGHGMAEVTRRHGDFAIAGAMATVQLEEDRVVDARLAFFGVGPRPVLAEAPAQLIGQHPGDALVEEVSRAASSELRLSADLQASPRFRAHLAIVVASRALRQAVAYARAAVGNGAEQHRPG